MPPDLTDTIIDSATSPKSTTVDGVTNVQPAATDIIAADRYLKANSRPASGLPFRTVKLRPGGNADLPCRDW